MHDRFGKISKGGFRYRNNVIIISAVLRAHKNHVAQFWNVFYCVTILCTTLPQTQSRTLAQCSILTVQCS